MNKYFNRTSPYSKSKVNANVNPVGTNVPGIVKISPDKSKDQQKKSTRANNKVHNTNPMSVGSTTYINEVKNSKPSKISGNAYERNKKDYELKRVDITKASNGGMQSRIYRNTSKLGENAPAYYKDDRGELHEIVDYNPNSNIQTIKMKKNTNKTNSDVVNTNDITAKDPFTGNTRISPYAKKKLMQQGFTNDEADKRIRDMNIQMNKERAEDYRKQAEESYLKQEEADTLGEKGASLLDNFFRGAVSGAQGLVTGVHQIGDAITSPFRSQESQEESKAQLEMLKAMQDKTNVGNYMQDDGLFGVAQQIASGAGNMVPSMVLGGLGGAGVGTAAMGLNAFGSGVNQAIEDTDDLTKARMYGLANAGTEMLTEKMFGAIPGLGKGILDNPLSNALKGVESSGLRKAGRVLGDFVGEGAEEYASTVIDEFLKDIYQGNEGKGTVGERLANVQPEALYSGLVGGLTGNLLNIPSYISNNRFSADNPPEYHITEDGYKRAVQGFQDYLNPNKAYIGDVANEYNEHNINYQPRDYGVLSDIEKNRLRDALIRNRLDNPVLNYNDALNDLNNREVNYNQNDYANKSKLQRNAIRNTLTSYGFNNGLFDTQQDLELDPYYIPRLAEALNSRERSAIKRRLKRTGRQAAEDYFRNLPPEQLSLDLDFNNYDPLLMSAVTPEGVVDYLQWDLFNDLKKKQNEPIDNNQVDVISEETQQPIAEPQQVQEQLEQQAIAEDTREIENFVNGDSDVIDEEYVDSEDFDYWSLSEEDRDEIDRMAEQSFIDALEEDDIDDAESYYLKEASHTLVMDEDFDGQPREVQQDYTGIKEKDPLRQEHIDKYGAIRPESKYKVEKSTDGKNRVHQTIDTLVNSEMFKGKENINIVNSIRDDVTHGGKGTYIPKTVQEVQDRARSFIDSYDSFTDAIESITNTDKKYQDKVEEQDLKADDRLYVYGKLTEDMIALKNANPNDVELQKYLDDKITDTLPLFTEIANESGRALRYIQAIRATVPAYSYAKAQLKMVDRFINRQNNILKKSGKEFVLPTEIQETISKDNPNITKYTEEQWQEIFRAIGNEAAKQAPKSLFDRLRTIRYLAMLMNPRTWIRNIGGNGVNYGFVGVSDVFRWAIENSISKFDKDGRFFYTVTEKGPFHTDKNLVSKIKGNLTKLNPNYGVKVEENALELTKNKNIVSKGLSKAIDFAQNINEYALDKPDMFFSQKKYVSSLAQVLERNGINADLLEYLINTPYESSDVNINGTVYTQGELVGKRYLLDKAKKYAERSAQEITYRQDNSFDKWLKKAMNDESFALRTFAKGINVIFPFTKTPFNIGAEMIKDSPLGIAQGAWELRNALKTGGDINHAIATMSKGLSGTGVLLLGMFLHSQGFLTGDGNDMDDKEKEFAEQRGWKPFAFRYDGDGATTYADISALTPMSMSLALGAVIDEMTCNYKSYSEIGENGEAGDRTDLLQTLVDLSSALAEPFANMSALSGIGNTLPQYTDSEGDWLVELVYNTGKNYASQFIPQVLKQINRTFNDPKIHTTQGMGNTTDKFISSLSKDSLLTSKNNNVAIDYRGNEKEYFDEFMGLDGTLGRTVNNFINPFSMSQEKDDATADELLRLYKETGESSVIPSNSYVKSYTKDGTKYEVNRDEWQEINEDKRQKYMQYVDEFVNSQEYQTMSDSERVEVIQALKDLATDNNKSMLLENKGVDYSSSMMNKVSAGEQQGLKAYQTVMLNPDKKALISTESTGDLLVSLSKNGFDEQGAREYLSSVGNEISENDEKMIKGMFQQGDTYNQLMDEFARSMPQGLDDYTQDKTYTKAGKKLAKCLGEYQQLMEGADVSTTDYERLARAMNSGVSVYEYLTIASHNSMKEEIEYMRDTLGRSADEIMWFEQNIMNRSKGKLNEAWEILNGN